MFQKHVSSHLSAYHHGEVEPAEKARIEAHFQTCSKCRADYEEIQLGARLASVLQLSNAPDSIWNELGAAQPAAARRRWIPASIAAGLATAVLVFAILTRTHALAGPSWEVTGLAGTSHLRPGGVL